MNVCFYIWIYIKKVNSLRLTTLTYLHIKEVLDWTKLITATSLFETFPNALMYLFCYNTNDEM
jgi:hypothetical protein